MYYPSQEQFISAASRGNLIPVYRELVADGDTPVSAYARLGRKPYSFLLESVVGGANWASYSFLGLDPRAVFRCKNGEAELISYGDMPVDAASQGAAVPAGGGADNGDNQARWRRRWSVSDPTAALAEVMEHWKPVHVPGLPRFWGGAVGWVGYDVVRSFERLPTHAPAGLDLPELCMVLTDTIVIFDNLRQTVKVVAAAYVPDPDAATAAYDGAIARIEAVIEQLRGQRVALSPLQPPPFLSKGLPPRPMEGADKPYSSFDKDKYMAAVARIREYILAGDIFQAVLSQRFEIPRDNIDLFDVYRALRVINPSPYMFHLDFPEAGVTGASPETLVRYADGAIHVRPIAGTRRRGADADEDDALERDLLDDPKECAEHLMLVDLGRNDVGRVARTGTVEVSDYMKVERYSHVMHIVSHVRGKVGDGINWHDVLRAAFPAGTLSGAPKIRAMEIIDELEPHRRGIYGGAVGYVSYAGNMDVAIAIRTLVGTADRIYVQAGGGIVHDSVPEAEYQETVNKASAVLHAVNLVQQQTRGTDKGA